MCNKIHEKIHASLDEILSDAKTELHLKQVSLVSVHAENALISAVPADLDQVDQAIVAWAKANSVNLVVVEDGDPTYTRYGYASFGNICDEFLSVSKEQLLLLNSSDTVLYFKRIDNMQDKMVRRHLLDFMRTHLVTLGDGKVYFAKNILFSIATISNDMDHYEYYELCTVDAKDAFMDKIRLTTI